MFNNLSDKLLGSIKKISGRSKISESNIEEVLKDIRMGLLEADVNFKVVKTFIDNVKAKALGQAVLNSVTPDQQFTKIVYDELVALLGGEAPFIDVKKSPSHIMLVGLQGVGKTTTTAKLAVYIRQKLQKRVGLVPLDVYRPAAIEQLQTLAKQIDIPCFSSQLGEKPQELLRQAEEWRKQNDLEVLILDTAGRLQIDETLMDELQGLKELVQPKEILLVADAMLGQQSVNVAKGFHDKLGLSGLILTKVDGDARGGAALSIRETVGIPIKFLGIGEKVSALEVFHPDRLASRILDRGDVVGLVEKAQEMINEKDAKEAARKLSKNEFTVEDFLKQIQMMKKMGGLGSIMGMLPGMGQAMKQLKNQAMPDDELKKVEAIINSMTRQERQNHKILSGSRRLRIAKGSGTRVQDVNKFVKQFEQAKKMMSTMMKMGFKGGRMPF
ncbi:MAG: signal recognition particle protein [Bdellovibrionaceae bacterium]|nr:signal recognition particle protein [Pseudobdellovibrionaceae bacterium]